MVEQLIIIVVIGVISVFSGLLMLFKPELLVKWGEALNRVLTTEEIFYQRRNFFGVLLLLAGIFMFYQVYVIYIDHFA